MAKAYFIQLFQPLQEDGVSYFGRPRDHKVERTSIACYTSRKGAEKTVMRLRSFKKEHGVYPSFELLHHIDIDDSDTSTVYRDRIQINYLHFDAMEYTCTLSGISLLMCHDKEGLLYDEHTFIEMGCDTYRDVLQNIIYCDNNQ